MFVEIKGFNGYYINELGQVMGRRGRLLSIKPKKSTGYIEVGLVKEGKTYYKRVHRLVAETFIHNPQNKPCVNHIDGDKTNNNLNNLEWCTVSENTKHASDNGLMTHHITNLVKMTKNNMIPVINITTGEEFESSAHAGRYYEIDSSSISKCCKDNGVNKSAGGYKWSHKEVV